MRVLFTVRRVYYDMIVKGEKTEEIRTASKRWTTIAGKATEALGRKEAAVAVFLCGRLIHERKILYAMQVEEGAEKVLGRPLSEQGMLDVGPGPVVVFKLGDEVPRPVTGPMSDEWAEEAAAR